MQTWFTIACHGFADPQGPLLYEAHAFTGSGHDASDTIEAGKGKCSSSVKMIKLIFFSTCKFVFVSHAQHTVSYWFLFLFLFFFFVCVWLFCFVLLVFWNLLP